MIVRFLLDVLLGLFHSVHFGLQDSKLGSCNNKSAAIFFMPSMPLKMVIYFAQHGWYLCAFLLAIVHDKS